jgi:hypothetical protein
MKSKVLFLALLLVIITCTSAFANHGTKYNLARKSMSSSYNGFWLRATLPTLNPQQYTDFNTCSYNKINFEYWNTVNNSISTTDQWIEMGYKKGYGINSDGTANCRTSYEGLFVGRKLNGNAYGAITFPSFNWGPGQSHTWGHILGTSSTGIKYAEMRTDNQAILTLLGVNTSTGGSQDVGYEWGHPTATFVGQTSSLPSYMTDLNVRVNGTWRTWNYVGGISNYDTNSGVTTYFNSSRNMVTFY